MIIADYFIVCSRRSGSRAQCSDGRSELNHLGENEGKNTSFSFSSSIFRPRSTI